ncbi:MAG: hypothetical protein MUO54_13080, partial [Anaerolineales bacterium]|nr:hypothetical protein [Anaerolineales bacterium]
NNEGGDDLDTSRCFMGQSRFEALLNLLPTDQVVIGIDEHTGLIIDFENTCTHVVGSGNITILNRDSKRVIQADCPVKLSDLGVYHLPEPQSGLKAGSWESALEVQQKLYDNMIAPEKIHELAEKRELARKENDWKTADDLRIEIENNGWTVQDAADGYTLAKFQPQRKNR